jgi:hypothetical protein
MITETQRTEIRQYLVTKNLPLDVIMEIEDHFVSQIENFEFDRNNTFEQAFYKTKLIWMGDFQMVWKSLISFGKVPRIVKDMQIATTKILVKNAFICACGIMLLGLFTARFFDESIYFIITLGIVALISVSTFVMILVFLLSRIKKQRTRSEKYFYNQILNIFLIYIVYSLFNPFSRLPSNSFKIVYQFVNGSTNYSISIFLLVLFQSIVALGFTIYLFLMMNDRARSIYRIKKFRIA